MVIDAHVHLYPLELNRDPVAWGAVQAETHWSMLCTRRRRDGRGVQGFPEVDDLLRAMDAAGVARSVLLGWYWQWPETCVWHNRFYAECVQAHPDRLSAFATVHPAAGREAGDQPRDLRPAPPGHLLDVAPQQAARRLALLRVLMLDQNALYPAINLAAICPLKPDFLAGRDEPANPFQMQILCLMHADVHSPA